MPRLISAFGLFVMMFLAWLMSSDRRRISWRVVLGGLAMQFTFAWAMLKGSTSQDPNKTPIGIAGNLFTALINHVDAGAKFIFTDRFEQIPFACKVLPAIIFFSALMSLLYHLGVLQWVVQGLGWAMQRTLGTSGAESFSAAANIFAGQTEAPLVVRPYLDKMTDSELMAVMTAGYASIAGGVMAAYVYMKIDAGHLLTASLLSAPASLLISKLMCPETGHPETMGATRVPLQRTAANSLDAIASGAEDGAKLAINVAAMLIAFLALIALLDTVISYFGGWFGQTWTLAALLGYLFAPFAWLMGVDSADVFKVGELIGLRMAANEFIAYQRLADWLKPDSGITLQPRSIIITTYALCGFANFGSIGIQIGGLGALVPSRRADFARLGFRAMLAGTLACFMTACIAGILL